MKRQTRITLNIVPREKYASLGQAGFHMAVIHQSGTVCSAGSRKVGPRCAPLPSVLVPGLDLRVCQVESRRQVHAVLHAEVFLSLKAPLQLVELVVGKGCPCFTRLFRAHRWTVSATGDLPVPFFFRPYTNSKGRDLNWETLVFFNSKILQINIEGGGTRSALRSNFPQLVQNLCCTLTNVWHKEQRSTVKRILSVFVTWIYILFRLGFFVFLGEGGCFFFRKREINMSIHLYL